MRPQRRQPTRLPRPWDSPGKNTGVGCHFLLQCMKVKSESEVSQSCPTLVAPRTAAHQSRANINQNSFLRNSFPPFLLPSLPPSLLPSSFPFLSHFTAMPLCNQVVQMCVLPLLWALGIRKGICPGSCPQDASHLPLERMEGYQVQPLALKMELTEKTKCRGTSEEVSNYHICATIW